MKFDFDLINQKETMMSKADTINTDVLEQWKAATKAEPLDLKQTSKLVEEMRLQRELYDEMKKKSNEQEKQWRKCEAQVVFVLQQAGMKKFNVPGLGTVALNEKYQVTMPKEAADKKLLFDYLRKQGLYDQLASINANTFKAYWASEKAAEEEVGNANFKMPGVDEPTLFVSTTFRKE